MKKILLLSIITLGGFISINAQSLTFEETVKYINGKMLKYSDYTARISAKQNGDILEYNGDGRNYAEYNLFDIKLKYELRYDEMKLVVICASGENCIKRRDKDGDIRFADVMTGDIATNAEAEKIIKAFNHLRTLCKKEVDPFD